MGMAEHFQDSPFALTADPMLATFWAGRPNELQHIQRVVRMLTSRADSTLDLVWANFGAGKTHALFHLKHLLRQSSPSTVTVFVEVPEQLRSFIEIYRKVVTSLPWDDLSALLLAPNSQVSDIDLRRALQVIAHGESTERFIALEWLAAGRPQLRELRVFTGISSRIETDAQATDMLSAIVRALASHRTRLLILFDELQRFNVVQERYRTAILSCLRSLFSRNPTHFSIVGAATTRSEKTAMSILPQELRTLMGMRPAISLPEMTEDEAYEFVVERFGFFRPPHFEGERTAPIGEEGIRAAIQFIVRDTPASLVPRVVLQALAWIHDEAEPQLKGVSVAEVRGLLGQLAWDTVT